MTGGGHFPMNDPLRDDELGCRWVTRAAPDTVRVPGRCRRQARNSKRFEDIAQAPSVHAGSDEQSIPVQSSWINSVR